MFILLVIGIILLILWALGLFAFSWGGLAYILLVIAAILISYGLFARYSGGSSHRFIRQLPHAEPLHRRIYDGEFDLKNTRGSRFYKISRRRQWVLNGSAT